MYNSDHKARQAFSVHERSGTSGDGHLWMKPEENGPRPDTRLMAIYGRGDRGEAGVITAQLAVDDVSAGDWVGAAAGVGVAAGAAAADAAGFA